MKIRDIAHTARRTALTQAVLDIKKKMRRLRLL
jgi:hypothetical protein